MKKTIILISIPLLLVLTVQICLKNPKTRELFTDIEKHENITYGEIPEGKREDICFTKQGKSEVEILFNGKKVATLKEDKKTVTVTCDGIFELINPSDESVKVTVKYDSARLMVDVKNTEFSGGLTPLCSVRLY